jgi:hypothetical protein
MTEIGVPGSPDGPPVEPKVIAEVAVMFLDTGLHSVKWERVPGRTPRQVIGAAVDVLNRILADDMLEKLEGDPPREPPL